MAAGDTRKVLLENTDGEYLIPYTEVASSNTVGRVKPDGTSTTVDANGVISVASAIQSGAAAGATAVQPSGVGDAEIEIQKNGTKVDSFTTNQSGSKKTINITVPTSASDVSALPSSTKYGASIDLSLDTTDYKLTLTLKDQDGTTLNSKVVDFPIESVVVNGSYDSTNQKIVLTLQNGNTIDIPVGALVSGLQSEITSSNKLDADLVDDSTSTHKFVTASDKTTWSGKQDTSTAVTHTASTAVGSVTQPVYIASDGTATATTYSLAKSVPSDAVFTDTTYSVFTGADGTTAGTAGLVKAPAATDNTKFLKGDGTWSDVAAGATSWGNITGTLSNQTDLQTALSGKQDTITGAATTITSSDLTASKALVSDANGKVATSSVTSTELGYVSGVTSAIQTQLGNKQATLISGTNIKTINSTSLLGSGDIAVQSVINSNNKLDYAYLSNTPTIPTVNNATLTITQNGTSVGTFTANASSNVTIATTDTTYSVFTGADGTNAGTSGLVKQPAATDNTKFLKGDGTWATVTAPTWGNITGTLSNQTDLQNALNSKQDVINWGTSSSNVSSTRPAVIKEAYVNGTSWYRLWSDGWCEQGGDTQGTSDQTVNLLKSYANINYGILTQFYWDTNVDYQNSIRSKTTASFVLNARYSTGCWYAYGYTI